MLRSSLRSSQKLVSLASSAPVAPLQGLDNRAYTNEELSQALASTATSGDLSPSPSECTAILAKAMQ